MKKLKFTLTFLFSALVFCHSNGSRLDGTVFNGNVTLSTQAEVDAFHYTGVTGNLTISGNDITNVDALSALTVVKSLQIIGNASLVDVSGFSALAQVGNPNAGLEISGRIEISNNPMLTNLDGFSALASVFGPITIESNGSLKTINGFSGVHGLELGLIIRNNPQLTTFNGFKNLTSMRGPLSVALVIANNPTLTNIDGISSLRSMTGKSGVIEIVNNAALTNIDGLSSFSVMPFTGGTVTISNNASLKNIDGLVSFTSVGVNSLNHLIIHGNASLKNLEGLSSIRVFNPLSPSGTDVIVRITENPSLSKCDDLYPLLALMGPDLISELTERGNLDVSGNGSGCTVEDILANAPPIVPSFNLIDLKTGTSLGSFSGSVIIIDVDIAHRNLNDLGIEAVTSPQQVGKVVFTVDERYRRTENYFPYIFRLQHLDIGTYHIQVDVYAESHRRGIGHSLTLNVINSAEIVGFDLVDLSGKSLKPLNNGDKIDLKDPMFKDFSIRAITWPDRVSFVKFWVNGQYFNTERVPPYALTGDMNSAYNPWRPTPGHYTLKAIPYVEVGGKQYAGESLEVHFEVVRERFTAVVGYDIVNTSGHFLRHLNDGDVLDLNELKHNGQTIVANTRGKVGSVKFDLNNAYFNIENVFPYTFTGDHSGYSNPWKPKAGSYTLAATPFSQPNARGNVGKPLTITFTVLEKNNTNARVPAIDTGEQGGVSALTIYPVPVEHELFVKIDDAIGSDAVLSILTVQGLEVYEGNYLNSSRISVADFKPGMYVLKVVGRNGYRKELKFIKK